MTNLSRWEGLILSLFLATGMVACGPKPSESAQAPPPVPAPENSVPQPAPAAAGSKSWENSRHVRYANAAPIGVKGKPELEAVWEAVLDGAAWPEIADQTTRAVSGLSDYQAKTLLSFIQKTAGPTPRTPAAWRTPYERTENGPEAELVLRYGDIDNLGFGWAAGFDPFSGASTPRHDYPFRPELSDPTGTDRIMVITGYREGDSAKIEGYTRNTRRPANSVEVLDWTFDPVKPDIRSALLQIFVDDFQAVSFGNRYRVWLNGNRYPMLEALLNSLRQSGPVGKLVTIELLPEYQGFLREGRMQLVIDDSLTHTGDGYALDFLRVLVNPKALPTGALSGQVKDEETGKPVPGAEVTVANQHMTTDDKGKFSFPAVPAGLVYVTAYKSGYGPAAGDADLVAGKTRNMVLKLPPRQEAEAGSLAAALDENGTVNLFGVYFDTNEATLKPESDSTLQQVLQVLRDRPALKVTLSGHTDNQGDDAYNLDLSRRRAEAVVKWLTGKGIAAARLQARGYGEQRPMATNDTDEGRAFNRRVELSVR